MKGWELYIWQDCGNTYFSLMVVTNRLKTHEEIVKAAVQGLDAIKPKLEQLKEGPELLELYVVRKQQIIASGVTDTLDYCHAKGEFMKQVLG